MHDRGPVRGLPGRFQTAGPAGGDERPAPGESLLSSAPLGTGSRVPKRPIDSGDLICSVGREAKECFSTGATSKRPFPF